MNFAPSLHLDKTKIKNRVPNCSKKQAGQGRKEKQILEIVGYLVYYFSEIVFDAQIKHFFKAKKNEKTEAMLHKSKLTIKTLQEKKT